LLFKQDGAGDHQTERRHDHVSPGMRFTVGAYGDILIVT